MKVKLSYNCHCLDVVQVFHLGKCITCVCLCYLGQLFQVDVSPDTTLVPASADIAPILCVPVDVKSKRNKGQNRTPRDDNLAFGQASVPPLDPNNKRLKLNSSLPQYVNYNTNPASLGFTSSNNNHNSIHRSNSGNAINMSGLPPIDDPVQTYSKTGAIALNNGVNDIMSMYNNNNATIGANALAIGESVNHIVSWATTIMRGIEAIQWREIGYEQNPDGTPNLARPLFNIPNPNLILNEIVEQ